MRLAVVSQRSYVMWNRTSTRVFVDDMGRFKKKEGAKKEGAKKTEEKSQAMKAYSEALLRSYKYVRPKDKRSKEDKEAWKKEAKYWNDVVAKHEREVAVVEQKRLDFVWESIMAIPEGPLRDAAMKEDLEIPPYPMNSIALAEIGPIPEHEIERLDPTVIDHTILRSVQEEGPEEEEEEKGKKPMRRRKK